MKQLQVSPDLSVPLDIVTQKLGFIGRTGSGKSYSASKIAEEMLKANAQIVVLDVVGVWWGLRLDADGKSPGFSIPVFGGLHGDIPLEPTGGKLVADLIIDKNISVVLDVSQFEADSDKTKFATDFADRFFFRKKSAPSAVHIFLEECQEVIPQNIQRGEERMLHAWQRLIRLGRNFGIGASMITQRPQDVNKKALNQAECVFCFQLTGPQERKAIDTWMSDKGLDLDLANDLPKLSVGEAHVWSPAWLKISKVVKIGKKNTFNASSTPEVGKRAQARDLAAIDLDSLKDQMKATIEKAKADDPKELKKKILELEKLLKVNGAAKVEQKRVEVPVLKDSQIKKLDLIYTRIINEADKHGKAMAMFWNNMDEVNVAMLSAFKSISDAKHQIPTKSSTPVRPVSSPLVLQKRNEGKADSTTASLMKKEFGVSLKLPKAEKSILTVLAQYPDGKTQTQVAIHSEYSHKSGAFKNTIYALRSRGDIEGTNECLKITSQGLVKLGSFEPLPEGSELFKHWLNNVSKCEKEILEALFNHFPNRLSMNDLAAQTESQYQPTSGAYKNCIYRLRSLELIEGGGNGIKLSDDLHD